MPKLRDTTITDPNHRGIRRIRALASREERERSGLAFVEGIRFVAQAARFGAEIETLVVAPYLLTNPYGRGLVARLRGAGCPCLTVSPQVYYGLARGEEPQGLAAVVRQRWSSLAEVRPDDGLCWVAIEGVRSPGNLGTIVRTCDAVGAAGVILVKGGVDPYDPAAVRATMGATFAQRLVRATPGELAAWVRCHAGLLVGTSPAAQIEYRAVAYRPGTVLLLGNERTGLSAERRGLCDVVVRLPMVGGSDSLNLAVATGVLLYEVFAQRQERAKE